MYSKAIELEPTNAIYYANRSLAYLRQECFGSALEDGILAVKNDPTYIKGYYRRAAAQMSLGKFRKALTDFELVAKRRPNDKDAAMKYTECNKLVRKQAFERAISNDIPEKTLAELYSDLESISMTKYIFEYQIVSVPGCLKSFHYLRLAFMAPRVFTNNRDINDNL